MSKRKSASAPKQTRRKKIAAKAHGSAQAVVKSPKDRSLRSAVTKKSRKRHSASNPIASVIENPSTAFQDDYNHPTTTAAPPEVPNEFDPRTPTGESPEITFRHDSEQTIADDHSNKGLDPSFAAANVWTYQAKLLEMFHANMQVALEFADSLATPKKWWR